MIRVRVPWTIGSSPAETRLEYDVRGNLIKKQTEQMRSGIPVVVQTFNYDQLNRLYRAQSNSDKLFELAYDLPLAGVPSGCPTFANTEGRLSARWDSYGLTYYDYDPIGNVKQEYRIAAAMVTPPTFVCGNGFANNPHTTYDYNFNGTLQAIHYPYGRTVSFSYGTGALKSRVNAISTQLYSGGAWANSPLVQNVRWEPYGGLRDYEFMSGPTATSVNKVEYVASNNSEAVNTTSGTFQCATQALDGTGVPDGTGRVRSLWVSNSASSTGNLLKQFYTWKGDQITNIQTCFTGLSQTTEHRQTFVFDKTTRLTSVTGNSTMPVRTTGLGATSARSYAYDRRGNRTDATIDGCHRAHTMGGGTYDDLQLLSAPDSSANCAGRSQGNALGYDLDGNVTQLLTGWNLWGLSFGYANTSGGSGVPGNGGLDSVVKSVGIVVGSGIPYDYYYDAFNRRRLKLPAPGGREEYFYDLGHQMLTSVASNVLTSATTWTVDDYIWLDGRPIAFVRGKFDTSWVRQNDNSTGCDRLGELGKCGTYHIINDYLPKPVMMIESTTNLVTNAALYDEFGHVNRVPLIVGFDAPASGANTVIGSVLNPSGGTIDSRMLANFVQFPNKSTKLHLLGAVYNPPVGGNAGHIWSNWTNQGANTHSTVTFTGTVNPPLKGAQVDLIEYRRYSAGATPTWTPIRFPGQFHDPETDLFENWNRFYDPQSGRYFQPEPLLLGPGFTPTMAGRGLATPPYSYAMNNPVGWTDPNGLLVRGHYFVDSGKLTLWDVDTMETVTIDAESGGKPYGDPVPGGHYEILAQEARPGYYRLDPTDGPVNQRDDVNDANGRSEIRLHYPGRTVGCIAAKDNAGWAKVESLLKRTKSESVMDAFKGPRESMYSRKDALDSTVPIKKFGEITVWPSASKPKPTLQRWIGK